uniref:Uncharacterized protein n=1 Tax=Anguilla anguilla TaxID=7936 RepID=A0A0E9RIS2_ANGAN
MRGCDCFVAKPESQTAGNQYGGWEMARQLLVG